MSRRAWRPGPGPLKLHGSASRDTHNTPAKGAETGSHLNALFSRTFWNVLHCTMTVKTDNIIVDSLLTGLEIQGNPLMQLLERDALEDVMLVNQISVLTTSPSSTKPYIR